MSESGLTWCAAAGGEAELAAGHLGVAVIEVGAADCAPSSLAEDLQRTGGKSVDVHPIYKPHHALTTCKPGGIGQPLRCSIGISLDIKCADVLANEQVCPERAGKFWDPAEQ